MIHRVCRVLKGANLLTYHPDSIYFVKSLRGIVGGASNEPTAARELGGVESGRIVPYTTCLSGLGRFPIHPSTNLILIEYLPMLHSHSDDLWAITCYFNPAGYHSRRNNYHIFRSQLNVPLVTVELNYEASFELQLGAADILIPIRGQDVMWQKERLLNIALASVPDTCKKVVWLDCDIVFDDPQWAANCSRALESYCLVQPYHQRVEVRPSSQSGDLQRIDDKVVATMTDLIQRQQFGPSRFDVAKNPNRLPYWAGLAWAARREVLQEYGLYDRLILGGGDLAIAAAAYGWAQNFASSRRLESQHEADFLAWAEPFYREVKGSVRGIHGRVNHLWHGPLKNRQYETRYHSFQRFQFDPMLDLAREEDGCWRWNSQKPEMHNFVREYFHARKEDD